MESYNHTTYLKTQGGHLAKTALDHPSLFNLYLKIFNKVLIKSKKPNKTQFMDPLINAISFLTAHTIMIKHTFNL